MIAQLFLSLAVCFGFTNISFAQEVPTAPVSSHHHHHHHGKSKSFRRGVCVGQTLAQEGIALPKPEAGQRPALDPATKAAFKAAVQSCRALIKGAASNGKG